MPAVEVHDLNLYYEAQGTGPPVLLIAGIPAVASDWAPVAQGLASAGHRAIAYDNRGSGATTVTPGPYTTAQLAADAVGLLDALDVAQADVFGMSLGGMIAQELALNAPQRVRRLVLGCTHAGVAHAAPMPRETGRAFALATDDWGERMRSLAPKAFAPSADPAMLDAFIAKKTRDVQDPVGYQAQVAAVLAHDTADRLPSISVPTLVMTGDADQVIPAASSDLLAERIPGARLVVVPGAGHLFFIERPAETLAALTAFLASRANVPRHPL